ncbi:MAG: efflux transporter periplasmic adaptor subunit [Thiobacillus sp. 65-29]|nr:MAG: efflux transporter periplasmic adaptor subunit [Thiobacillus sp. 65-29]
MQTPRPLSTLSLALTLSAALSLAACGKPAEPPPGAGGPGAPGAAAVTVVTVQPGSVPVTTELPGRTTPYLVAELRPQVSGIIKARLFTEGGTVKAGEVLYQIDPATYQATFDSARASLARAEANLDAARIKAERYAELVKIEAVSKQDNDDAAAALKQGQAEVSAARAGLDRARIDLAYTRVTSPISGRIGRSAVTPGALVTANQSDALATVQQLDPIHVDVTQSSADLLRMKRDFEAGVMRRTGGNGVAAQLVLEDGSVYAREGRLAFSEVTVDPGTGSVTLRAVFPNPRGELLPGMYVRARLAQGSRDGVFLLPHAALIRDPKGNASVMVVNAQNQAEARPVKATQSVGDKWMVIEGLAAGDRVIVEGLQRVKPGAPVQPQDAAAPQPAAAAPAKG